MTRFRVDLAELDAVTRDLQAFDRTLSAGLRELDRLVARLQESWTGQAADAQAAAHQHWAHGAQQMHAALVEMHRAAQQAHDNYSAAAQANVQMWRQAR